MTGTVVPRPASLSISMVPRCSSMMFLTIERPSPVPVPFRRVEKNGSKTRLELGRWNPNAVVLDLDQDAIVTVEAGGQAHLSAFFGRGVARVGDEIDEDLMKLAGHCIHLGKVLAVVELHGDACLPDDVLAETDGLLEHVVEQGRLRLFLRRAARRSEDCVVNDMMRSELRKMRSTRLRSACSAPLRVNLLSRYSP